VLRRTLHVRRGNHEYIARGLAQHHPRDVTDAAAAPGMGVIAENDEIGSPIHRLPYDALPRIPLPDSRFRWGEPPQAAAELAPRELEITLGVAVRGAEREQASQLREVVRE
jgi:hypothetical protein